MAEIDSGPKTKRLIKPNGGKYLHRSSKGFKFKLVARFRDGRRSKQTLQEPEEWDEDKLLKITDSLDLTEGKLADFPEEKRVCLRKAQRDKELDTNGKTKLKPSRKGTTKKCCDGIPIKILEMMRIQRR